MAYIYRTSISMQLAGLMLASCSVSSDVPRPQVYPVLSEPSHKPVFHNDRIDVYQVRLKEGEETYYHRHSRDELAISMSSYSVAGQAPGKSETIGSASKGTVVYIPISASGGVTHRVRAVKGEAWIVGIEFAEAAAPGATMIWANAGQPTLQFSQGRVERRRLAPGESSKIAGNLILPMTAGSLQENASKELWNFAAGELKWIGAAAFDYRNNGTTDIELLVLTLNYTDPP